MNKHLHITRREFICNAGIATIALVMVPAGLKSSLIVRSGSVELMSRLPVSIKTGLIDQDDMDSLGLPELQAGHKMLYDARSETFKYSHHMQLGVFRDRLYAMWSSGRENEDWPGQRVLWTHTVDGQNWKDPSVLVEPPDGDVGPRFAVASGFYGHNNYLTAYYASTIHDKSESDFFAISTRDERRWSSPYKIASNAHMMERPRQLPNGRLLVGGMYPDRTPRVLFTDSRDGIYGWTDATIPSMPEGLHRAFPEPNWFICPDGTLVLLLRAVRTQPWLYASVSTDLGKTWSAPEPTNIPSATSRMAVGNLPDGRAYCIWNPSQHTDQSHRGRTPLVIALSTDFNKFDQAWVIRSGPVNVRYEGISKVPGWQYPSAVVWRNALWVGYSVNKEDVAISRIALTDLR